MEKVNITNFKIREKLMKPKIIPKYEWRLMDKFFTIARKIPVTS